MIITRRAFTAALSLTGLAALAGFSPLRLITGAMAQSAADVAKPVSLPDMAIGPADAPVTITEFASMTCPHCAAFNAEVFPKIKAAYVDTGKVRYIFREFPLDPLASTHISMRIKINHRWTQMNTDNSFSSVCICVHLWLISNGATVQNF